MFYSLFHVSFTKFLGTEHTVLYGRGRRLFFFFPENKFVSWAIICHTFLGKKIIWSSLFLHIYTLKAFVLRLLPLQCILSFKHKNE